MKYPLYVGIGCKKGSGKTTFAQLLASYLKCTSIIPHFADALKAETAKACGVTIETIEKDKAIFRPLLQWWGTEFRKGYGKNENYWIDKLEREADFLATSTGAKIIIVPDVRFPSEANFIKKKGGLLIKVTRFPYADSHISETALDDFKGWDIHVDNRGTLKELKDKAKLIASSISPD